MRIQDFVKEGDTLRWGGFGAHILHTPGHTPGSISLVVEPTSAQTQAVAGTSRAKPGGTSLLLAGDTLFHGSIGRTDLPGGSFPQILSSIREKLLVLPEEMVVFPGHGDTTTIGEEREQNPFLR
jgi:glyoxylase-like metal-dependent hydrolase (beta-lactamase superfamily II)